MGHSETMSSARDLRVPTEKTKEILQGVTDEGRQLFINEMLDALNHAEETGDLSHIQRVVNAWWISGLFFNHENIDAALAAAEKYDPSDLKSAQEIGEYLKVA